MPLPLVVIAGAVTYRLTCPLLSCVLRVMPYSRRGALHAPAVAHGRMQCAPTRAVTLEAEHDMVLARPCVARSLQYSRHSCREPGRFPVSGTEQAALSL